MDSAKLSFAAERWNGIALKLEIVSRVLEGATDRRAGGVGIVNRGSCERLLQGVCLAWMDRRQWPDLAACG
ncbi:hypothetical protein C5167_039304 [Papaver somniferum]|uniref:Uncharacterized protein n=1 Tax=Papaver somniferum TaxID=3469 RepID=A0A4Y7IBQ7_PAPSO|nr:hypothetical protein C5167_039304 [Papaver somniferum]